MRGLDIPPSTRLANTASPPMPSARMWWKMTTRAQPPSASPSTSVADHSGRWAGSGHVTSAAAVARSAVSSPGARLATAFTWWAMSKSGSSTHTGLPQPHGVGTNCCRNRRIPPIRSAMLLRTSSKPRAVPGPKRSRAPTCLGAGPMSEASSIMSAELARSIGVLRTAMPDPILTMMLPLTPVPEGPKVPPRRCRYRAGPRSASDFTIASVNRRISALIGPTTNQ